MKKQYTCGDAWINVQEFLFVEKAAQAVEISFAGIYPCDIDFVCLYPCVPYPSVSILVGSGGLQGKQSMFLAPGKADAKLNDAGTVEQYFEPPYRATYSKYKFWFPHGDDTEAQAKKEREEKHISFDDDQWGFWSSELAALDIMYLNDLIDALIPVGVKVFELLMSRRGH